MILAALLAAIVSVPAVDAEVGFSALHLESGRRLSHARSDEAFPMGSVYKFPVAIVVLRQVDAGVLALDDRVTIAPEEFSVGYSPLRDAAAGAAVTLSIERLLELMLGESDNTAVDYFITRFGGGAEVTRMLNFPGIRIDRTEREIGEQLDLPEGRARYAADPRDSASPARVVDLFAAFQRRELGLSEASHHLARKIMLETPTGRQRIKSILPAGATFAHKTGTMPGTANDAGIITTPDGQHIAIAIFTRRAPASSSLEEREQLIAAIARMLYRDLTRPE